MRNMFKLLTAAVLVGAAMTAPVKADDNRSDGFCKATKDLIDNSAKFIRESPNAAPVRPLIERNFIQPAQRTWEKHCGSGADAAR